MAVVILPLGQMTSRMPSRFPKVREWPEVGNIAQDLGLPPALGAKGHAQAHARTRRQETLPDNRWHTEEKREQGQEFSSVETGSGRLINTVVSNRYVFVFISRNGSVWLKLGAPPPPPSRPFQKLHGMLQLCPGQAD